MSDGKDDVAKKEKPKRKWRAGVSYTCIHSASPGYRVGETYTAHKNDDGHICLTGRDGYVDICGMLVSEFKEVK